MSCATTLDLIAKTVAALPELDQAEGSERGRIIQARLEALDAIGKLAARELQITAQAADAALPDGARPESAPK